MNDKRLRIDLDDHLALMMAEINSLAAVEGAIESHRLASFCSNSKSWVVSLNSVYACV